MGGDGDEVARAFGGCLEKLFVAVSEGVDLGGEGRIYHGNIHWDEGESLADGNGFCAVPLLGFVEIKECVDRKLEAGQAGAGGGGFLDAAAGGDDCG